MQEISGTDDQRQGVQECHREREKGIYIMLEKLN